MLLIEILKSLFNNPANILVILGFFIFPLLISVTVHEWAHGFVAYKFGDPTPKEQGRLSFNPFAHLDPIGTLMLFIAGIGWAKPVMINPENIKGRTRLMLVALAGPLSNIVLAIIFAFVMILSVKIFKINLQADAGNMWSLIIPLFHTIVKINLALAIFNLMPIPPLDGSNIIAWVLPEKLVNIYQRLASFGMIILFLLLFTVGFKFISTITGVISVYLYGGIEKFLSLVF